MRLHRAAAGPDKNSSKESLPMSSRAAELNRPSDYGSAQRQAMTDSTCIDQPGEERGSMPAAVNPPLPA